MRKVNLIVLALVAIYLLAAPLSLGQGAKGGKAKGGNVEEQIKTLSDQLVQAWVKGDTSFFNKYLADDYMAIYSLGQLVTKAEESRALKYESLDARERKIRVYGDTAVAICLVSAKGTYGGKSFSADFRVTHVWVKRKGNWKIVAFQVTRVAPASQ